MFEKILAGLIITLALIGAAIALGHSTPQGFGVGLVIALAWATTFYNRQTPELPDRPI